MTLNQAFADESIVERISSGYSESSGELKDDLFHIIQEPFKVLKLNQLFDDLEFISKLTAEVKNLNFHRKNNDLYGLWQSEDLTNSDGLHIAQFVSVLRKAIGALLSRIMKVQFNENFTLTASLYEAGDVLLCHDDKCTDRCVAFVYYLTGTGQEKGGAFEMFEKSENGQPSSVVKSLPPVANSLLCFEVGNFTYHQVSEVAEPGFERLSLNGWFHSDRELPQFDYLDPMPPPRLQLINAGDIFFDEYVNSIYTAAGTLREGQKKFEIESQILFQDFLRPEFYSACKEELKRIPTWTNRGPANRRQYGVVEEDGITEPNLKKLLTFLGSPPFFSYLSDLTGLSMLSAEESEDLNPSSLAKFVIEVQRWGPGDYTMATDNDEFFKKSGLDLYLWFNSNELNSPDNEPVGTVSYLAADDDDDEEDEDDKELLNIDPVDNALVLVYRTEDTIKFNKYLSLTTPISYHCIAATYYEAEGSTQESFL